MALKRRCRYCSVKLSYFYPVIEAGAVLVVVWAGTVVTDGLLVATSILGWLLLCLGVVDWRSRRLPDGLTTVLCAAGLGAAWLFDHDRWPEHAAAAFLGGTLLWLISWSYNRLRGRDGLGLGDAKLFAAIGAWVSLSGLPSVLFVGAILATGASVLRNWVNGTELRERIAFGPFLATAAWFVWLYGPLMPSHSF